MSSKKLLLAGAVSLLLLGAGCVAKTEVEVNPDVAVQPDMGFTMEETPTSGAWTVTKTGGTYVGSYASEKILTYYAITPPASGFGRGATWKDYVGYRKLADGHFELTINGTDWWSIDETYMSVIGEVPLKKGLALVLGPANCEASPACYSGPGLLAVINTPKGILPGGVFQSAAGTILEAFEKNGLDRVSIE